MSERCSEDCWWEDGSCPISGYDCCLNCDSQCKKRCLTAKEQGLTVESKGGVLHDHDRFGNR